LSGFVKKSSADGKEEGTMELPEAPG